MVIINVGLLLGTIHQEFFSTSDQKAAILIGLGNRSLFSEGGGSVRAGAKHQNFSSFQRRLWHKVLLVEGKGSFLYSPSQSPSQSEQQLLLLLSTFFQLCRKLNSANFRGSSLPALLVEKSTTFINIRSREDRCKNVFNCSSTFSIFALTKNDILQHQKNQ